MSVSQIQHTLISWFRLAGRDLSWRSPDTSPWGILLSEVMSQQTPVARVEPSWLEWIHNWPTPRDLAEAPTAEVLRAWGSLGYPRRALRLKECAQQIVDKHGGEVPDSVENLLSLPGIGDYTARAVAAFAFGQRVPVVDTNVRRVFQRAMVGKFLSPTPSKRELIDVASLLPQHHAPEFSAAIMELGALMCTATKPQCQSCPIRSQCQWQKLGCPAPSEAEQAHARKRVQKFAGTDRQVRGLIMNLLRTSSEPVDRAAIDVVWLDEEQRSRALFSLIADGLASQDADGFFQLPE